jgi:hypothetical protein
MRKYRVQIEGKNFLFDQDGELGKYGFFTFRFVEAENPLAAENAAISMLRDKLRTNVKNDICDPPLMDVLEVSEVSAYALGEKVVEVSPDGTVVQPGLIIFPMNPKRWWQFWRRS